jgi:hypothetical protein
LEQGETVQAVLCEKAAIAFLKSKHVGQVDLSSLVQVSSTVKGMHAKAVQCLIKTLQLRLDVVACNGLGMASRCQSILVCVCLPCFGLAGSTSRKCLAWRWASIHIPAIAFCSPRNAWPAWACCAGWVLHICACPYVSWL